MSDAAPQLKLSLSQAADAISVTKGTLKGYIKEGRVRANPDGTIDTDELRRAGFIIRNPSPGQRRKAMNEMVFCRGCGKQIHSSAPTCPQCGAPQKIGGGKSKVVAGVLAILLGSIGIHRFYLRQWWGIFYLLFFWTFIPAIIGLIEGVAFLLISDQNWDQKSLLSG